MAAALRPVDSGLRQKMVKVTKKEGPTKETRELSPFDMDGHFLSLRDAMDRLFDESFLAPFEHGMPKSARFPKVDISETDKNVKVVADLPGIDPEQLEVEVDEDSISLSGKTEKEEEDKDEKYYRFEREYGEFKREFALPAKVDPDNVSAKTKHGKLTITLPKVEGERRKKIKIDAQ